MGAGTHANAFARLRSAAKAPAMGVMYPISSKAPPAIIARSIANAQKPKPRHSSTELVPWTARASPIAALSRARPTLGHPPGNVDNVLCKIRPPVYTAKAVEPVRTYHCAKIKLLRVRAHP